MVSLLQDDTTYNIMELLEQNDRKCYLIVPLLKDETTYKISGFTFTR